MKLFSAAVLFAAVASGLEIDADQSTGGLHPDVVDHLQSNGIHPDSLHPSEIQQLQEQAHAADHARHQDAAQVQAYQQEQAKHAQQARARVDPQGPVTQHEHYKLNDHYDNNDNTHHHYGSDKPASPAYPNAPEFTKAVDAFDTYGTLFGEHRYQLQVAKTGNMLIGTEALREAIQGLQQRVQSARQYVHSNDKDIDINDQDISYNRQLITENREKLHVLDGRIHDLEQGYDQLHERLSIDREAVIMMCHQYAYAESIPYECNPIIGSLQQPIEYRWHFPEDECPGEPALPPFPHPLPQYEREQHSKQQQKQPQPY